MWEGKIFIAACHLASVEGMIEFKKNHHFVTIIVIIDMYEKHQLSCNE